MNTLSVIPEINVIIKRPTERNPCTDTRPPAVNNWLLSNIHGAKGDGHHFLLISLDILSAVLTLVESVQTVTQKQIFRVKF